jgi:hypothetical protein
LIIEHVFRGKSGLPILEALEWKKSKNDDIIDIANEIDDFMLGKYVSLTFNKREIEFINTTTDRNTCVTFKPGMMALRSKKDKNTIGFMTKELVYNNYVEVLQNDLERDS